VDSLAKPSTLSVRLVAITRCGGTHLELWTRFQPNGARVQEKLTRALELLRRYDLDASEALGLDLEPASGLPLNITLPDYVK
jgi:hypothetical protein